MQSEQNNFLIGINDSFERIFSKNHDYRHIMLMAPHGSGKGVCFVLPNLLLNNESAIIHDIKLENYQLTAAYRASLGHRIFMFNPLDESQKTHRYNPLDFISLDKNKIFNDIDQIANLLITGEGEEKTACKNLLIAIIFYLYANPAQIKTLGNVARIVSGDIFNEFSNAIDNFHTELNEFSLNQFKSFLSLGEENQNLLIRNLSHFLSPFLNPLIDYATSASDFNFSDFKKNKATLYIGILPSDIKRLEPFLNFFYNHILQKLMQSAKQINDYEANGGVSLYLDEFYLLGKLSTLENSLGYLRGYKIRLLLIASDFERLENIYGEDMTNAILADCFYKIFYSAKSAKSAKKIAEICINNFNKTALFNWQEILTLDDNQQIILEGCEAKICHKFYYYQDSELKAKLNINLKF